MERGSEGEAVRARVGGELNRKWSNQGYKKKRETKKERKDKEEEGRIPKPHRGGNKRDGGNNPRQ